MAISQLNANEIINIASDYLRKYDLNEKEENEIKNILIEKGYKKFYIFQYIAKVKNFLIISKNLKFTIELPTVKERLFFRRIK